MNLRGAWGVFGPLRLRNALECNLQKAALRHLLFYILFFVVFGLLGFLGDIFLPVFVCLLFFDFFGV